MYKSFNFLKFEDLSAFLLFFNHKKNPLVFCFETKYYMQFQTKISLMESFLQSFRSLYYINGALSWCLNLRLGGNESSLKEALGLVLSSFPFMWLGMVHRKNIDPGLRPGFKCQLYNLMREPGERQLLLVFLIYKDNNTMVIRTKFKKMGKKPKLPST